MTLAMTDTLSFDLRWVHAVAAGAFLLASAPQMPLLAQGLESEKAIESIVGSEVETEQHAAQDEAVRVVAAIENASDAAERVRKAFNVNELRIVFLPDVGEAATEVEAAIAENEQSIEALREAIEGSALFYHAVDSRRILVRDIFALEFGEDENVTIFVAGEDPNG